MPILVVGVISLLTMNINGVPRLEWLLPGIVVGLGACYCASETLFSRIRVSMLLAAAGLSLSFLSLVHASEFTTHPERVQSLRDSTNGARLRTVARDLCKVATRDEVLPSAPITPLLNRVQAAPFFKVEFQERWHTWLTGIKKVANRPATVWCVGDLWKDEGRALELRPAAVG